MTNLAMWSLIIGALMPPLVAIIQQPRWSGLVRSTVMVVSSIVAGAGTAYFENDQDFSAKGWLQASLLVAVAAISAYHGIWKPNGVAPRIEKATAGGA